MSKIGRAAITIPAGISVSLDGQTISVAGPKGQLTHSLPRPIKATLADNTLTFARTNEAKPTRALHGLTRALVANMVEGVGNGFRLTLKLVGTGYRARLEGSKLVLSLGFSHPVEYLAPTGISLKVDGTDLIHIEGIDKQVVGQVAAEIRAFKKPEPYKGKGIRYEHEVVRRKAGKAAKSQGE